MKAVFTCDDVFDVLTRAPFPSGIADDAAVESHLAVCHECRQMAEALRPGVELFHEALAEEKDLLPAYRGTLPAIVTTDQLQKPPQQTVRRRCRLETFGAIVASAALMVMAISAITPSNPIGTNSPRAVASVRPLYNRDLVRLAALDLPSDCAQPVLSSRLSMAKYECCTKCHRAGGSSRSSAKVVAKATTACLVCHEWRPVKTVGRTTSSLMSWY